MKEKDILNHVGTVSLGANVKVRPAELAMTIYFYICCISITLSSSEYLLQLR